MRRHRFALILPFLLLASFGGASEGVRAQARTQPRSQKSPSPPSATKENEPKAQEGEVIRVDSDLVNIFFTAVDRNRRFITTLAQQDIRVMEDGTPQEVFTFQREADRPLSIAILIDVSASEQRTLPAEKAVAQGFINTVIRPRKDQVAVISFTGDATLEQGMTDSVDRLQKAIDQVEVVFPS